MKRIPLNGIRSMKIKEIIEKTFYSMDNELAVKEYLQLNDSEVDSLAKLIYERTFGNPREISIFMKSLKPGDKKDDWKERYTIPFYLQNKMQDLEYKIYKNSEPAFYLYECFKKEIAVDLTKPVETRNSAYGQFKARIDSSVCDNKARTDFRMNSQTYEEIADKLGNYWDGEKQNAKLYVDSRFQVLFESISLEYSGLFFIRLLNAPNEVLNRSRILQMICFKVFSKLLGRRGKNEMNVKNGLRDLFKDGILSDNLVIDLRNESVSVEIIPKVTCEKESLDVKTINPADFHKLLDFMLTKPKIYFSLPGSSSSDVIIVCEDEISKETVVIGLAVKNFISCKFNQSMLANEIEIFTRMFKKRHRGVKKVLVICSTNYTETMNESFKEEFYTWKKRKLVIDGEEGEIELYNLDLNWKHSHLKRFLGLEEEQALYDKVREIIEKEDNIYL